MPLCSYESFPLIQILKKPSFLCVHLALTKTSFHLPSNSLFSKSFLASVRLQVKAAENANEGISAEYERGSRTTLDVIQSNTLLLNAQISLANSERNYLLAQYNLLKSIGLLNSDYLKLK